VIFILAFKTWVLIEDAGLAGNAKVRAIDTLNYEWREGLVIRTVKL
jgi:hypothetical protein